MRVNVGSVARVWLPPTPAPPNPSLTINATTMQVRPPRAPQRIPNKKVLRPDEGRGRHHSHGTTTTPAPTTVCLPWGLPGCPYLTLLTVLTSGFSLPLPHASHTRPCLSISLCPNLKRFIVFTSLPLSYYYYSFCPCMKLMTQSYPHIVFTKLISLYFSILP